MQKSLVKSRNSLAIVYFGIVFIVVVGSLSLYGIISSNKKIDSWMNELDRIAQTFTDYVEREGLRLSSEELTTQESELVLEGDFTEEEYNLMRQLESESEDISFDQEAPFWIDFDQLKDFEKEVIGVKNYLLFIFDIGGNEIVERGALIDENFRLWPEYKSKLLYEMFKNKNGWIHYPDLQKFDFNQKINTIRYFTIPGLNLLICVEGVQDSRLNLVKEVINPMILLIVFLIFICSIFIFKLIAEKYIEEIEDKSIGQKENYSKAPVKSDDEAASAKLLELDNILAYKDDVFSFENEIASENAVEEEVTLKKEPDYAPETQKESSEKVQVSSIESQEVESQTIEDNEPVYESQISEDDKVIKLKDVKSPLLRKLLEEIRAPK